MATRKTATKTLSKHDTSTTRRGKARGRRSIERRVSELLRSPRRASARADVVKYVIPGVVATGALLAAGYGLKDQLGDVVSGVLKAASKQGSRAASMTSKAVAGATDGAHEAVDRVTEAFSIDSFLKHAGLQRRSTAKSILSPAIGALCGFVAGSAVTFLLGPQVIAQLTGRESAKPAAEEPPSTPIGAPAPTESESPMSNGRQHGIS
jgi:hypothetical protein